MIPPPNFLDLPPDDDDEQRDDEEKRFALYFSLIVFGIIIVLTFCFLSANV